MQDLETVFFNYVDWTTEEIPRPFYVGKGTLTRIADTFHRNPRWKQIAAEFGHRREVVYASKDEQHVYNEEIRLITELGTFENSSPGRWGANQTKGGQGGVSGAKHHMKRPEYVEHIRRMLIGRKDSDETRARKSAGAVRGASHHMKLEKFRAANRGENNPAKRSEVRKKLRETCPFTRPELKDKFCGENHGLAKLTWENVAEIRKRYLFEKVSHMQLSREYEVTKRAITCVLNHVTWKVNP